MKKPGKKKDKPIIPVVPIIPGAPSVPVAPVSRFDPEGSWTGMPVDHEKPVQDADDL